MNQRYRSLTSFLAVLVIGLAGCQSNAPADSGTAKPSSFRVYIGTFTGKGSQGIYLMSMDPGTGALGQPQLVAEASSPSFLALHPNHRFLYSVNEIDQGGVSAYAIDSASGKLSPLNQQPSGGNGPTHIAIDRNGTNVWVANYGSGSVEMLPVESDGKLGTPSAVDQHQGKGADPSRQSGPHAHCVNVDPGNHFLLSADLGLDKVFVYKLNINAHTMTPNDPPSASVEPASGPRHLAFHPSGKYVYVTNEMSCTVTAFHYNGTKGTLESFQNISTLPADFQGDKSTAEIMVHPSGKFLFVSNRGNANSIARFRIDPADGKLTMLGTTSTQGKTPRSFGIDPTGTFLIAANQDSDNVVVFRIDPATGDLNPTGVDVKVPTPVCVTFLAVR
jgi:6-phosphogluconolactonase